MVKSIIKRIIVGVGIALCLMAIKGNLFMNAHALSCDSNKFNYVHPINRYELYEWANFNYNDAAWNGFDLSNDYYIYFQDGYDFMEIQIPTQYSFHAYENATTNPTHLQMSSLVAVLIDNTNNNNGAWNYGSYENGFLKFKFYRSEYPEGTQAVKFHGFRVSAPRFYGNWNSVYGWVKIEDYWKVYHYQCDSNKALEQEIQNNTQAVENIENTMKDSSTDDPSGSLDSMNNKISTNGSITQLLTLPIQLYQNILNATTVSCSQFNLGSLFGHNLTLPCINLQRILGSTLYSIIDILISGIFILSFRKKMVDIFNNMTSLKDRGNELE